MTQQSSVFPGFLGGKVKKRMCRTEDLQPPLLLDPDVRVRVGLREASSKPGASDDKGLKNGERRGGLPRRRNQYRRQLIYVFLDWSKCRRKGSVVPVSAQGLPSFLRREMATT